MADMVIETIHLEADVASAIAIGQVDLVALFGSQVDITQLDGIGTDVEAVAGEFIDRRRPETFGDIQLHIIVMLQLISSPGTSGPTGIGIVERCELDR